MCERCSAQFVKCISMMKEHTSHVATLYLYYEYISLSKKKPSWLAETLKDLGIWILSYCRFKPIYKLKPYLCQSDLAALTSIENPTKVANLCKEHPLTSYLAVYASGVSTASMDLQQRWFWLYAMMEDWHNYELKIYGLIQHWVKLGDMMWYVVYRTKENHMRINVFKSC